MGIDGNICVCISVSSVLWPSNALYLFLCMWMCGFVYLYVFVYMFVGVCGSVFVWECEYVYVYISLFGMCLF